MTTMSIEVASEELREWYGAAKFLNDLFRLPCEEQWIWLNGTTARDAWRILAGNCTGQVDPELPLPESMDLYEQEFLTAFEVGFPQPLCSLRESHWNRKQPVPKVLHENILFYQQFGLRLREEGRETSDHFRHQIEFLAHLFRLEAEARESNQLEYAAQFAHGTRDFLNRHVNNWLPLASKRLSSDVGNAWPAQWLKMAALIIGQLTYARAETPMGQDHV